MKLYSCLLLFFALSCQLSSAPSSIDVVAFAEQIKKGENLLLDVRTAEEFEEGHIEGAVNIDYTAIDFEDRMAELDQTQSYLVYCKSGKRSAAAIDQMKKMGFEQVTNLKGGCTAWTNHGFPLIITQ